MTEMKFIKVDAAEKVSDYLSKLIASKLSTGQNVVWLVSGGSAITVTIQTARKLSGTNLSRLSVTLTDERYIPVSNRDSNWRQLLENGFSLKEARIFPVIKGEGIEKTTEQYDTLLKKLFDEADYKIGLFGMGPDGHIASLFPDFKQLKENKLYAAWLNNSPKPPPERITMTIPAIKRLDEAVIFALGRDKQSMIERLSQDVTIARQPAQTLKTLPKLTVFNDHKES